MLGAKDGHDDSRSDDRSDLHGCYRATSTIALLQRYNGSSSLPWRSRFGVAMSPSS